MVIACNYIARSKGIKVGMTLVEATRIDPEFIMIPAHYKKYKDASINIMKIFSEYDPNY